MRFLLTAATAAALCTTAAWAQAPKPAQPAGGPRLPAAAPPAAANPNTVLATVNGDPIRMSDVLAAEGNLPPEVRAQMPPQLLTPRILDQLVAQKALLIQAHREGLDRDPATQRQMQQAANNVLQNAVLRKEILPKLSEDAIKAQYDKQYAGKPGEPEVHARHILVDSEAKAKDIIAQLNHGAKFDELAKKYGDKNDAATQQGGDLGYFKKGDMLPEFSAAAFALKPNQITQTPVHTRYGWHVIQVLDTRTSQPPSFDQVHDELKNQLLQQNIKAAIENAKSQVKVVMNTGAAPAAAAVSPATTTR